MFKLFGEFNSVEELNQAAAGQKEQGDLKALKTLAGENGIDIEYAIAYAEGALDQMADYMTAAIGKLDVEIKEAAGNPETKDSIEAMGKYLQAHCTEESLARNIRKKGKRLSDAVAEIRKAAEKRITKRSGTVCVHIPQAEVYQMLRDYYGK